MLAFSKRLLNNLLALCVIAGITSTLLVPTAPVRAAEASLDPELAKFEQNLETKIENQIKEFFGPDTRILVNVHAVKAPLSDLTKKATADADTIDVGYVPLPVSLERLVPTDDKTEKAIFLRSLEVDLGIPAELDQAAVDVVKSIATRVVKTLPATVAVQRLPANPLAKTLSPEKFRDQLMKPDSIAQFISIVAAAFVLALGIGAVALAFKGAAKAIAEGFQTMRMSNSTTTKPIEMNITGGGMGGDPEAGKKEAKPESINEVRNYTRDLKLIKQVLRTQPVLFLQTLDDSTEELAALRALLPNLDDEEQESMRRTLGEDRIRKLDQAAEADQSPPQLSHEQFSAWMHGFVERLMVRKIQGGSPLEKMLGAERTLKLFTANPDVLLTAVQNVDDRAAWRIGVEFLPAERLERQFSGLDDEKWAMILGAGDITAEEAAASGDRVVEFIDQAPAMSKEGESKAKYFSGNLLSAVIGVMLNKKLDTLDHFVEMLERDSPEFTQLLRENVWTPRSLMMVPDDYLTKVVKSLSTDQKVALIVTLPADQSERIHGMVPQGNVRIIVDDMVKKARAKADAKELASFEQVCREFLDYLRRQGKAGQFPMESAGGSPAEATGATAVLESTQATEQTGTVEKDEAA